MCMYVHVYMSAYLHTYMHTFIPSNTYEHTDLCIFNYIYAKCIHSYSIYRH